MLQDEQLFKEGRGRFTEGRGRSSQGRGRSGLPRGERILVIRLGALGDVLRTLPAVTALRTLYPASHLAWLVEPAAAAAVRLTDCVDETIVFPRGELVASFRRGDLRTLVRSLGAFLHRLRERRFEVVLDFHGLAKSCLLAGLSGAPLRYGYGRGVAREGAHLFSHRSVDLPSPHVSRFERNAALVRALSAPSPVLVPEGPIVSASAAAQARLEARLDDQGRAGASGFVLIHPGSSAKADHKRYAPAAWCAVANRLVDAGLDVWLAAGPAAAERALVDEIRAGCGGRVFAAPETPELDDLLALISRASVFAACDSGPLHAATLCGVPVVQLLGPTDPVHNEPAAASPWRRLHVPLPCSPCRRGCGDPACMRAIAPARVAEAIASLAAVSRASRTARIEVA